jgi:hypothetical protein
MKAFYLRKQARFAYFKRLKKSKISNLWSSKRNELPGNE